MNLKKIIREKMDDLQWIHDVPGALTPKQLIGYYFKWRVNLSIKFFITNVDSKNIHYQWKDGGGYQTNDMELEVFIKRVKERVYSLYDANGKRVNPDFLLYESNDLQWIHDIPTLDHDYLKGKALEFNPPIKDYDYANKVIDVLEKLGFSKLRIYNSVIEREDGYLGFYLKEDNGIIWTGGEMLGYENYQEHIEGYAGKPVQVLDGRSLFDRFMDE